MSVDDTPPQEGLVERLRELLAKATAGPWAVHPMMAWISPAGDLEMPICQMRMATDGTSCEPQALNDAKLIVEAVNALPTLFAALTPSPVQSSPGEVERTEQVISAWAFAHDIDGAARNDLFKRLRESAALTPPSSPASAEVGDEAVTIAIGREVDRRVSELIGALLPMYETGEARAQDVRAIRKAIDALDSGEIAKAATLSSPSPALRVAEEALGEAAQALAAVGSPACDVAAVRANRAYATIRAEQGDAR